MKKNNNLVADKDELIHILDENGNETNVLENRKIVHEKGLWHQEVACVIINKKKQFYYNVEAEIKNHIQIAGLYVPVT